MFVEAVGADHEDVGSALNLLAVVMGEQGRYLEVRLRRGWDQGSVHTIYHFEPHNTHTNTRAVRTYQYVDNSPSSPQAAGAEALKWNAAIPPSTTPNAHRLPPPKKPWRLCLKRARGVVVLP